MCGRKTLTKSKLEIIEDLCIDQWDEQFNWKPNYNITPTQVTPILTADQSRNIKGMRWGLVPSWAKDIKIGNRMINARCETISEKSAYRNLLRSKRCLVITDGYYEWQRLNDVKQPYYIHHPDHELLPMAGLWDEWTDSYNRNWATYTVITTEPAEGIRHIHNRMPVILADSHIETWMNVNCQVNEALRCLQPYSNPLLYHPVTTRVNSPVNNSDDCIKEITLETK